jgi:CheY-like chemotaxis protein
MTNRPEPPADPPVRILLIEDNEANRRLMSDYLTYYGYSVSAIADARAFEATMEAFQPQLILLDLKLPTIDGYALMERIQRSPDWRQIPVIVVSAHAFQRDQQRALDLGARRYFVKPIRLTELMDAIREELANP